MHQAKSELSALVARAEAGEEIVIARRNKPAVKLVPVEAPDKAVEKPKRRPPVPTSEQRAALAPPADIDWFEHAPDDYISKQDIAAYYRKYPHEWDEMRRMVGFAEDSQADYDMGGIREAVEKGREFTIMREGKPVARVAPVTEEKPRRKPGGLKGMFTLPDSFFDPLPDDEIAAWEGRSDPDK
jgi:prevent-host-death family protein